MVKIKTRILYRAFGLKIASEIRLPELTETNDKNNPIDISIEIGNLTSLWNTIGKKGKFIIQERSVLFGILDTAIFCIQEGNKIIVSPFNNRNEDKIRLFILGSCMGILLMQRKILPLHGSAIAIDGKAYALVGDSGAGKSTLASAFLNKGYQLLSDDVVAVSLSNQETPTVFPSYPQQKLWKESLIEFGMETESYRPLFDRETKFAVPVDTNFFSAPLPLGGIIELVKTEEEEIEIHRMEKLDRLYMMFRHTFRNSLIPRLGLLEWHFRMSTKTITKIDMYRLQRPISSFTADDLVSIILATLGKEKYE